MGFFDRIFKSKKDKNKQPDIKKQDFSYVSEIGSLITGNDKGFMKFLNENLTFLQKDCTEDWDFEYWSELDDMLDEEGWLFSADYKSEPEDILWGLSHLKSYHLIEKYIHDIDLTEIEDAEALAQEINLAVSGAFVCTIDIDSDSYELIIVTHEIYEKISAIAENNGHSIEIF